MLYQKKILLIFVSHCFFSFTWMEGAAAAAATTTASVSRDNLSQGAIVQQALDAVGGRFVGVSARVDAVVKHILDYSQPRVIRFELRPKTLTIHTDGKPAQEYAINMDPYSHFESPTYCWGVDGTLKLDVGIFMLTAHYGKTMLISIDQDGNATVCLDPINRSPECETNEPKAAFHVCRDLEAHRCATRYCEAQLRDFVQTVFRSTSTESLLLRVLGTHITGSMYDIQEAATGRALVQEFKRRISLSAATSSSSSSARSLPEPSGSTSETAALVPSAASTSAAALQGPAVGP